MKNNHNEWKIIFLLPNLSLDKSIGNDNIAIVPANDPRLEKIVSTNKLARSLVENFEDQFGRKMHPAVLMIRAKAPEFLILNETIVGFRNIFALSCIIKGHEHSMKSSFVAYPVYSDHFDFYPISLSEDNDGFITSSPSIFGFDDDSQCFKGQTSPALINPASINATPDENLFQLLENAWERCFLNGNFGEWRTTTLFRSLEMAYQASSMPFKNHSTIYDHGSSVSLWVSALEILSHPRKGKADLCSVLNLLDIFEWKDIKIKKRAYKICFHNREYKVNLVQKLYKELYDTRNDFLHGNPVSQNRLYPFRKKGRHTIIRYAPLIYKVALLSFLKQHNLRLKRANWQKEYISNLINERSLSEAFLKLKNQ